MIKYIGSRIGINHGTDEIIKTLGFVNIHHVTFHCQRRHVNHRRTILPDMISEHARFINRLPAHTTHIIRFRQHLPAHEINGEFFRLLDSLIGIMLFTHTDEYAIMTDNTRMSDNKPIHLSFHFRTNNSHRLRIESQQFAEIFLFHFHYIGLVSILFHCRAA